MGILTLSIDISNGSHPGDSIRASNSSFVQAEMQLDHLIRLPSVKRTGTEPKDIP